MKKQLLNSISFRQAKLTVIVAVILGIVISLGQLFIDLNDEKKRLDDTMHQVLSISRESAVQATVNLDNDLAEQITKGLFQFSPIYKVKLVDNFGDILAARERDRPAKKHSWSWLIDLILEPSKSYSVELLHPDSLKMMGVMTVDVDIYSFTHNFFSRAYVVILSWLLLNILLAFILFILFHYILTKPLLGIISAFAEITPGNRNTAIKLSHTHRNDELGVLAHTINNVLNKFAESLERHRSAEQKIKKSEVQIKASLNEKEVLLREIHHRVKNNMQIICSLLNLQSEHIDDKRFVDVLIDSQNRIRSMALVHEKLYRSEDLSEVDLSDYVRTLAQSLFASYGEFTRSIKLNIDINDVVLAVDTAIPCGLIINELLSNCLKHAFPDHKNGEINISFKSSSLDGKTWYTMSVSDNGVGIPEGLDIRHNKSLGLQLIMTLAEHQLQGKLELQRKDGTAFTIRFKELKVIKRT